MNDNSLDLIFKLFQIIVIVKGVWCFYFRICDTHLTLDAVSKIPIYVDLELMTAKNFIYDEEEEELQRSICY